MSVIRIIGEMRRGLTCCCLLLLGRLEVSNASCCVNYDRKEVDAIILTLMDHGHEHFADALRVCKRESVRPGALRILRELPR